MRKSLLPAIAGIVVILTGLYACAPQKPSLQSVRDKGVLHVLTRNSATTYFQGPHGPEGIEYELAKAFANHLGVSLKITTDDSIKSILEHVQDGDVDFAAAGLTVTAAREEQVRFTPPYQHISQQVIYHRSTPRPENIDALNNGTIEVIADSSHAEKLKQLQSKHSQLSWSENNEVGSSELLSLVAEQLVDYTIADSNEVILTRRFHPELGVAFDVSSQQPLAWAFPKNMDDSLYQEAVKFIKHYKNSGQMAQLLKRHYGHARKYDYAGTTTYLGHVRYRLPRYRQVFERAAIENELDWRLLAAVAYQESHWNPRAISPTGVKGIMMLTNSTAEYLGVGDRTDPEESILGGARYLKELAERFESDLDKLDRLWFALAAYNVGFGHLQDARYLTQLRGGNPNKWMDVKESLPLLRRKRWYKKTKYGYARGTEPVRYVENIRSYYDILHWHLAKEREQTQPQNKVALISPAL